MEEKTAVIYCLINSFDMKVFYVGKTLNTIAAMKYRLKAHINSSKAIEEDDSNPRVQKNILISDILKAGGEIIMMELDTCPFRKTCIFERKHYLHQKSLGLNLRQRAFPGYSI